MNEFINLGQTGSAPLITKQGEFSGLTLGYSTAGATSTTVMRAFTGRAFSQAKGAPNGLGVPELQGVINDDYDVTFTFAPWLMEALVDDSERSNYEIVPWFQSVPYPFSSVVFLADDREASDANELLLAFFRHLLIGLATTYRYKHTSMEILKEMSISLRHFGLHHNLGEAVKSKMVTNAFGRLVLSDCFCESLENAWVAWDLAFDAQRRRGEGHLSEDEIRTAVVRLRNQEQRHYDYFAAEEEWLSTELQSSMKKMVEHGDVETF